MLNVALSFLLAFPANAASVPADTLEALKALEQNPAPSELPKVIEWLGGDESAQVREGAARLLGLDGYRKPDSLSALARALNADPSDRVRRQAAVSALTHEGPEPIALISGMLRAERGDDVRRAVIVALANAPAHLENSEATSALMTALQEDGSPYARSAAADALGARGDKRALAALSAAAKDPDAEVRKAAQRARARLELPKPVPARVQRPQTDQRAAIKGKDRCSGTSGWCECSNGPMKPRTRCLSRPDCEHTFANSYSRLGYVCTWDGQPL